MECFFFGFRLKMKLFYIAQYFDFPEKIEKYDKRSKG